MIRAFRIPPLLGRKGQPKPSNELPAIWRKPVPPKGD